jgi:hypothetical protein
MQHALWCNPPYDVRRDWLRRDWLRQDWGFHTDRVSFLGWCVIVGAASRGDPVAARKHQLAEL